MQSTSKRPLIDTIQAAHTEYGIIATIHTRRNQTAVIGRVFASLRHLKTFILSQGLNLELLNGGVK